MLAVGQMDGSRQGAFLLNTPPLAALHSMTEMKTPLYPAYPLSSTASPTATSPNPGGVAVAVSSPGIKTSGIGSPQQYGGTAATPHGINDILSRPSMGLVAAGVVAAAASSSAGILSGLPRFSSLSPPPPPPHGLYFSPGAVAVSRYPKPLADLPGRTPIFWPGVMQSPHWRDARFACSPRKYFLQRIGVGCNPVVRNFLGNIARVRCGGLALHRWGKLRDMLDYQDVLDRAFQ